jgi:hypothetical protein
MKLEQLFEALSFGELSNLSMSNNGNGTLSVEGKKKVLRHTNEGLLRLYSRFVLKEADVLIRLTKNVTNYHLVPRFAVNYQPEFPGGEDDESLRYILDLPRERFTGDVLKVLSVTDSDGCRLPLNDDNAEMSVFTPQGNVLQVPDPIQDKALAVVYQARHVKLLGELDEEIQLPELLEGALTAFVAYKIYSHMNTSDSLAIAQGHLGNYEKICSGVVEQDLVNASISTSNSRFKTRGWI